MARRLLAPWLRTESLPFIDRMIDKFASRKLMDLIQTEDFDSDAVLQYDSDVDLSGHSGTEMENYDDDDASFMEWKERLHPDLWNMVTSMVHNERHLLYHPWLYEGDFDYFKTKTAVQDEVINEICDGTFECNSLRRIKAVLRVYHEFKDSQLWVCYLLCIR